MHMGGVEVDLLPGACKLDCFLALRDNVSFLVHDCVNAVKDLVIVRDIIGEAITVKIAHLDGRGDFSLSEALN